jgi:hypothetical protein
VDRAGRELLEWVLQQAQPVKEEGVLCSRLIGALPPTMVRVGVKCSMRGKPIWTSVLEHGKFDKAVDHLMAVHAASIDNAGICSVVPNFHTGACFESAPMLGSGGPLP